MRVEQSTIPRDVKRKFLLVKYFLGKMLFPADVTAKFYLKRLSTGSSLMRLKKAVERLSNLLICTERFRCSVGCESAQPGKGNQYRRL